VFDFFGGQPPFINPFILRLRVLRVLRVLLSLLHPHLNTRFKKADNFFKVFFIALFIIINKYFIKGLKGFYKKL
jgi:hypothetical protein